MFNLKPLPAELRTAVYEAHLADCCTENDLDSTSKTAFLALTKVCHWMREDVLLLAFSNSTFTITNPGQAVAQRFGNLTQPLRDAIQNVHNKSDIDPYRSIPRMSAELKSKVVLYDYTSNKLEEWSKHTRHIGSDVAKIVST
ncbi:hypothetical protein LTS18_002926 [Coniosporium uncinatum]|uniref:Uncharacterized protein n=1 Tax=Coniosporium uncinatum TaxID=93489 RepID=A0ACC3DZJ7_9PEZI|nr:hypothetical protein LTS18_002926 [Coniosporium uncinatum]